MTTIKPNNTVYVFKERAGCPGGGKGILIAKNSAFTLATNFNGAICYEKNKINNMDDIYCTLRARNNDSCQTDEVVYAIEGNVVDRISCKNGKGWCEGISPTLNTQDRHAVVFTIDAMSSNSMKSSNPHSGIHETNTAKCLDTMCLDPSCNQGGHMVVIPLEGNGARPSHMGNGYSEEDTMYTLNATEQHSVCYAVDCRNNCLVEEMSTTLQAKPQGGWSVNVTNPILIANGDEKD